MVFAGMVPTMFGAAQRVMGAYTTYQSVAPSAASTYELLDTRPPTVRESPGATPLGNVRGNLVFDDVVFGYSSTQKVLDGLSFSVAEGETVALVGGIGSGKSTVYNLVLRFLDPQRGRILLDGHAIDEVTIASLRDQVSKLAQFPFFVKDTIRENIRLARPGPPPPRSRRRAVGPTCTPSSPTRRRCPPGTTRWWTCRCPPAGRNA